MPRVLRHVPTNIYWLIDVRPETLIEWPKGRPFYCGKTIFDVDVRFAHHRNALQRYPNRPVSQWLKVCEGHVRVQRMEVVPFGESWVEREQFWILTLRTLYPGGANITSGGQGTPGNVHTRETRARMSAAKKGRNLSPEHCAKISAVHRGRKRPVETGRRISNALKTSESSIAYHASRVGQKQSIVTRNKIGASKIGKKRKPFSKEHLAALSASKKGRVVTVEHRAKISAAKTGKKRDPFSPEWRANLSASQRKRHREVA